MKFKSEISYLGEKISILPRKMAEQWAVELDVKNPDEQEQEQDKLIILLGYCS